MYDNGKVIYILFYKKYMILFNHQEKHKQPRHERR